MPSFAKRTGASRATNDPPHTPPTATQTKNAVSWSAGGFVRASSPWHKSAAAANASKWTAATRVSGSVACVSIVTARKQSAIGTSRASLRCAPAGHAENATMNVSK